MKRNLLFVWSILGAIIVLAFLWGALYTPARAGSTDNLSGWAWSQTIGWISFNSTNDHDPDTAGIQESSINYGVDVDASGNISGYAWSEHIGWISFDESSGCPTSTANPTCAPKINKTSWEVEGWARACAGTINGDCTGADRTDGWDGWISLYGETPDYRILISDCDWNGYAWGNSVVGWVITDSDVDHDPDTAGVQASSVAYGVVGSGDACQTAPSFECDDGIDNADPEDTLFDIQDAGCYDTGGYSLVDDDETDTLPACSNFFDDNSDGETDAQEPGCYDTGSYDPSDDNETETLPDCSNFFDDDGDGLNDANDPGCYDSGSYDPSDTSETDTLPECSNFFDDDGDGDTDLDDDGCVDGGDDDEGIPECSDGIDNDGDGLFDEDDPGCWDDPLDPDSYNPSRAREKRIRIIEILPE